MVFFSYMIRNLALTSLVITMILTAIVFLTQSLRFLELVFNSAAASYLFWILTILTLPRFLEVLLPIALGAAAIFVYNRLQGDSELVIFHSAGFSPFRISYPALILAGVSTVFLLFLTLWVTPVTLSQMIKMRKDIKAEYSTLLLKEGVFNTIGDDLTVYIRERANDGSLLGLVIHDSRETLDAPVTVLAKRGAFVDSDDGQKVVVFDGSRQDFNPDTGALNRLDFNRYTIDLPDDTAPAMIRWKEPEERTFWQLLNPDMSERRDVDNVQEFYAEAHRRVALPFLAPCFVLIALTFMILRPAGRRGSGKNIFFAITSIIGIQALFLVAFNLSDKSILGIAFMYLLVFVPSLLSLFLMSIAGEDIRRKYVKA